MFSERRFGQSAKAIVAQIGTRRTEYFKIGWEEPISM
jgi:hypothetical protein